VSSQHPWCCSKSSLRTRHCPSRSRTALSIPCRSTPRSFARGPKAARSICDPAAGQRPGQHVSQLSSAGRKKLSAAASFSYRFPLRILLGLLFPQLQQLGRHDGRAFPLGTTELQQPGEYSQRKLSHQQPLRIDHLVGVLQDEAGEGCTAARTSGRPSQRAHTCHSRQPLPSGVVSPT
jgi:hypothetical protein